MTTPPIKIYDDVQQRSLEWRRLRAGVLTASNMSRLLTPGGKSSSQQDDLILSLCVACLLPEEDDVPLTQAMMRGIELEPEARSEFSRLTGLPVREVGFIQRTDMPAGCSPDGLVGEDAGLEIKCPGAVTHASYVMAGGLPDKYRPQVHGSLAVTGFTSWYFMSYCPGLKPLVVKVERDDYTARLAAELETFAAKYRQQYQQIIDKIAV